MKNAPFRFYLTEEKMPKQWYNLRADLKTESAPLLHPGTLKPITKDDLTPIFCEALAEQELNTTDRYIDIPQGILDYYKTYRPAPLCRAYNLERFLDTPAKIYFKFEGNNTSGSHKLNSAAAQVYYAKEQGITSLCTETGAGQWGTALSMACAYFGIDLEVFMVKGSAMQKPYRKAVMETYGASVIPSPSDTTKVGREILKKYPDTSGSLGCAISEAIERSMEDDNCRYALGSVLNQVLLHQSVIGTESLAALNEIGDYPDVIVGCAGGGSNLGGLIAPFVRDIIDNKRDTDIVAVEPSSCPSLTRGKFAYDFCDTGRVTPLAKMYTLGCEFIPSPSHAGGLRYHGMSPVISQLYNDGVIRAISTVQTEAFKAASDFAKVEGILPAPESSHAIYGAIVEALKCKESGESKTILFGLTGTGYFDMAAYSSFMDGSLNDRIPTDEELAGGFATLPL